MAGRMKCFHPTRSRSMRQQELGISVTAALSTQAAQVAGYYNPTTTNSPFPKMILHLQPMTACSVGEEEEDDEEGR